MPEEIIELEKERDELKKKLSVLSSWAARDVKNNIRTIARERAEGLNMNTFSEESKAENIEEKITGYFGHIMLMNAPHGVIDDLTTSEVNYYNLMQNPGIDGLSVVTGYHKALDTLIESFITKGFRKFAKKKGQTILRTNDPLEKTLHMVVNKGYILGFGRLYGLTKHIRHDDPLFDYGNCFSEYLDKYYYIKDILLEDAFFHQMTQLANSEVLGSKRHRGNISESEALKTRNLFIGGYNDKNAIIYKLLDSQSVEF